MWQNRRVVKRRAAACAGTLLVAALSQAQNSNPDIIVRATKYVDGEFVPRFTSVVAEEHFTQETVNPKRRRELRSDYLLVTVPGQRDWYQFRDTYEVDGQPVPGHDERLAHLFLDPPADVMRRAAEVNQASGRYSLEDIGTLDNPLTTIAFLQDRYVTRFRYTTGRLDKSVGADIRMVQFNEYVRPTILKGGRGNADFPTRGLLWIEQGTGRVMKTELNLGFSVRPNQSTTIFRFDPDLQVAVPLEMREEWQVGRSELKGVATYGHFRRFGVQTEEKIR
jgi:hypothetical protein